MNPDTITVDEIEDEEPLECQWMSEYRRPWPEIKDAIIDVTRNDLKSMSPYPNPVLSAETDAGIVWAVDSTLRAVVVWLEQQGYTAIANDLRRAGDI